MLIGAGDSRYLALAGLLALLAFAPLELLVRDQGAGLTWLWAAYGVFLLARMTTLVLRVRGGAWARIGAAVR